MKKIRRDAQTSLNKPKALPWDPAGRFCDVCLCDHCWSWVIWTPNQNTPWTRQSLWCAYDLENLVTKTKALLRKQRLLQPKIHTKHYTKKSNNNSVPEAVIIYRRDGIRSFSHSKAVTALSFLLIVPYYCIIQMTRTRQMIPGNS